MSSIGDNDGTPGRPGIGGLLRMAWQEHRDRLYARLRAAGYTDITRAQFALLRWPGIDGLRPSEIAEQVGLSKQTVNGLLGELERAGYLERQPDPEDGRARRVRFSARGRELQSTTYETSLALEAAWVARVGERRYRALRDALETVVEQGLPEELSA